MERLTEKCWRNLDPWECCGQDHYCTRGCHDKGGCVNGCIVPKIYIKLAKYEDAEEQGLLLRLQFKIGQKVYYIYESCIDKSLMIGSMIYSYSCLDFPRQYFATKEEAEQALKQMGE